MKKHNASEKVKLDPRTTRDRSITIHRTVKVSSDAEIKYGIVVTFDFSSCKPFEIMQLAANSAWITLQGRFRKAFPKGVTNMPEAAKKWERTYDVKAEFIDVERASADPVARADSALDKLTPEQLAAVIAKHTSTK